MLSYNIDTSEVVDYRNPSDFNNGNCTIMKEDYKVQHGLRRVIREEKMAKLL